MKSDFRGALSLLRELSKGNLNPGTWTKTLKGSGVRYARGKNGIRVFFKETEDGIQIVGMSTKHTESRVIEAVQNTYGK